MESQKKYAYFYDNANRTELFCTVTQAENYGMAKTDAERAARKILPNLERKEKGPEKYRILKTENVLPFGSFLSDILSNDFDEIINVVHGIGDDEQIPWENMGRFAVDVSFLATWGGVERFGDIEDYAKSLYAIRKYVEMCIDRPRLYTLGQFHQLLSVIGKTEWHLQTLGFFAPAEVGATGRFFFNDVDGEHLRADSYRENFRRAKDVSELDRCLENGLLEWSGGDYLPSPALEFFEISNVVDVALLSLFHLLLEQNAIKKCANCGKFFVPLARSDAIYCDRPAPQNSEKTCKEYGSKVLWYESIINDEVIKLSRNIYCAKQMLMKRNPDKPEYAEMFNYFKVEKKKWEQQVKAGAKTREEYAEWLRVMKLCKTPEELRARKPKNRQI